jgi:hypothetical protein
MRWRLHTAYGAEEHTPTAGELETYIRWAAQMRSNQAVGETE